MRYIKPYLPSLGMVLATVLGALYAAFADNTLSLTEFLTLVISLVGAITTYIVPRLPQAPWLKTLLAGVTAALVFAVAALVDGEISSQEWVMVFIQLLAGLGIVAATSKNAPIAGGVIAKEAT